MGSSQSQDIDKARQEMEDIFNLLNDFQRNNMLTETDLKAISSMASRQLALIGVSTGVAGRARVGISFVSGWAASNIAIGTYLRGVPLKLAELDTPLGSGVRNILKANTSATQSSWNDIDERGKLTSAYESRDFDSRFDNGENDQRSEYEQKEDPRDLIDNGQESDYFDSFQDKPTTDFYEPEFVDEPFSNDDQEARKRDLKRRYG